MDLNRELYLLLYRTELQDVVFIDDEDIPDFKSDPRLVLREMMKREDWPEFSERLFWYIADKTEIIKNFCEVFILDTTGKLVKDAIKFMKEKEK